MYLQLNMVKYDADWEITNIYENLQIVWSQFFTDMLLFIYIQSTSNIYWFIGIRICCQWIQRNTYSVTFDYLSYSVRYLMNKPTGKKTTIRHYLIRRTDILSCPPGCHSVFLPVHPSICLSICPCISLYLYPSIHQSVSLFIHSSICLTIHPSINLSVLESF